MITIQKGGLTSTFPVRRPNSQRRRFDTTPVVRRSAPVPLVVQATRELELPAVQPSRPSTASSFHRRRPPSINTTSLGSSALLSPVSPLNSSDLSASLPRSPFTRATSAPLPDLRAGIPQRVETPLYLNSPRRKSGAAPDAEADSLGPSGATGTKPMAAPLRLAKKLAETLTTRSTLRDNAMLADACRRAGRTKLEGQAHYHMGVLHDNAGEYIRAIECYKKYLLSCRRCGDADGEAIALNHLGVDYQLLGADYYQRSIACHSRHRDIADIRGKYVAHCNLGLVFSAMGQHDRAAQNFRHALRYAINMSNLHGESFAYEHLAATGTEQGDLRFARECMERALRLATTLGDTVRRHSAFNHLGKLATARGDFDEASRCFSASLQVAQEDRQSDAVQVEKTRCDLGVALGNQQFEQFMNDVASKMKSLSSPTAT